MNVEDLIIAIALTNSVKPNQWDEKLVYSFTDQISRGLGFTEKQGNVALRIVKTYSNQLTIALGKDIQTFLKNPTYRLPFRQINNTKKISIHEHSQFGKIIKVEFPYNETYVNIIRKNREQLEYAQWSPEEKAWIFALTENSIQVLSGLFSSEQFELDEIFQNYLEQVTSIKEHMEEFIPMLAIENGRPVFKNITRNLPKLEATDTIQALFEARQKGVTTWSNEIFDQFDSLGIDPIVKSFLDSDPGVQFHINSEKDPISCLSTFIKYLGPTLFVIPGGNELTKLRVAYNFLKSLGIENYDMSVMFRLGAEINRNFNNFVKENDLNSPLGENTKIVFISSKMPKPVLKSNIRFHSIINMGFEAPHYSIRDFMQNHENLIVYSEKTLQREFNFVIV
jgi:hypothetical protein